MFCPCLLFNFCFLTIAVRPIIPTSTGPIFTEFVVLVELWLRMNDVKLFFDPSRDVAMTTNFVCCSHRMIFVTLYLQNGMR